MHVFSRVLPFSDLFLMFFELLYNIHITGCAFSIVYLPCCITTRIQSCEENGIIAQYKYVWRCHYRVEYLLRLSTSIQGHRDREPKAISVRICPFHNLCASLRARRARKSRPVKLTHPPRSLQPRTHWHDRPLINQLRITVRTHIQTVGRYEMLQREG